MNTDNTILFFSENLTNHLLATEETVTFAVTVCDGETTFWNLIENRDLAAKTIQDFPDSAQGPETSDFLTLELPTKMVANGEHITQEWLLEHCHADACLELSF